MLLQDCSANMPENICYCVVLILISEPNLMNV